MAQTPEGKVKDKVKKLLKEYSCYFFMPVQTGYGSPTLDILACCKGIFIAIETKAPGKKMTPRQILTAQDIKEANGTVFTIDGDTDELERFLKALTTASK